MAITAEAGPFIVFGQAAVQPGSGIGQALDSNPHRGPSLFDQFLGLMDPRYPFSYQPGGKSTATYGWMPSLDALSIDAVPSTLGTTAVAAAQVPTANTPLTLVSASGAGITVGQTITNSATGVQVTGLLVIDGASGAVSFGQSGGNNIWDPTKMLARNVQIASVGNDSAATFTVRGYDVYWYPMTETITGANAGTASGAKAFKYIASITPAGTLSGSNVSAGQGDKYGFPLRVDRFPYAVIFWNGIQILGGAGGTAASGTFTAADTTSLATATTGDVRGTYLVPSASDGTKRLIVSIGVPVANMSTATGLTGVTQYTG